MKRDYFDVRDEYRRWSGDKETVSLSDYAQTMDRIFGSTERQAAYNDGIATKINAYLDIPFKPIGEELRPIGEAAGAAIDQFLGTNVKESMGDLAAETPRTLAEFTPWFAPLGKGSKLLKAATAGSAFARGTAETGNVAGGVVGAATLPAMPLAGRFAEGVVGKKVASGLADKAGSQVLKKQIQEGTRQEALQALSAMGKGTAQRYLGAQAGMAAAGVVSDTSSAVTAGGSPFDLLTDANYWVLQTAGQVPFLGLDVPRLQAEITAGRKITAEAAKRREKLFDSLVAADKNSIENAEYDALANKIVNTIGPERIPLMDEWREKTKHIVKDPSKPNRWVSPQHWLRTNEFRVETPQDVINLISAYNESLAELKAADALTATDLGRIRDDLLSEGEITAERLQQVFDGELSKGADVSEATLRITEMVRNRLRRNVEALGGDVGPRRGRPIRADGVAGVAPEGNFRTDSTIFFKQLFENAGYSEAGAKNMLEITDRLSVLYENVSKDTRMGRLRENILKANNNVFQYLGLYAPGSEAQVKGLQMQEKMIAVLGKKFVTDQDLDITLKMSATAHELFHAHIDKLETLVKNNQANGWEQAKFQKYQKLLERFNNMGEGDRRQIIHTFNNVMLPESKRNVNGERDPNLLSLEIEAARSGKETMAMLSQMVSLGVLNPRKNAKTYNSLKEALKWTSDEVAEFANMQYRSLAEVSEAMRGWHDQRLKLNFEPDSTQIQNDMIESAFNLLRPTSSKGPKVATDANGLVSRSQLGKELEKLYPDYILFYSWKHDKSKVTPEQAIQDIVGSIPKIRFNFNSTGELSKFNTPIEIGSFDKAKKYFEDLGYEVIAEGDYVYYLMDSQGDPPKSEAFDDPEFAHQYRMLDAGKEDKIWPSRKYPDYSLKTPHGDNFDFIVDFEESQRFTDNSEHYGDAFNQPVGFIRGTAEGDKLYIYELQSDNFKEFEDGMGLGQSGRPYYVAYQQFLLKAFIKQAKAMGYNSVTIADPKVVDLVEGHVKPVPGYGAKLAEFKFNDITGELGGSDDLFITPERAVEEIENLQIKYADHIGKRILLSTYANMIEPFTVLSTDKINKKEFFNNLKRIEEDTAFSEAYKKKREDKVFKGELAEDNYNGLHLFDLNKAEAETLAKNNNVDIDEFKNYSFAVYKPEGKKFNYGEKLPSILAKITGKKGVPDMLRGAPFEYLSDKRAKEYLGSDKVKGITFDISDVDTQTLQAFSLSPQKKELYTRLNTDLKDTLEGVEGLMRTHQEVLEAQEKLASIHNLLLPTEMPEVDITMFDNKTIEALGGVKEAADTIRKSMGIVSDAEINYRKGSVLGKIETLLGNPSQLSAHLRKRGLHKFSDVIDYVQEIPATVERYHAELMRPFLTVAKGGKLVPVAGLKHLGDAKEQRMANVLEYLLSNDNANQAFTDIALLHNELARGLTPDDPDFKAAVKEGKIRGYDKLDNDGKTNIWHLISIVKDQNAKAGMHLYHRQVRHTARLATEILRNSNPGVDTKVAHDLMDKMMAYAASDQSLGQLNDMQTAAKVVNFVKGVNPELDMSGVEKFLVKTLSSMYQLAADLQARKDYYFTERRVGDWLMRYQRPTIDSEGNRVMETVVVGAHDKTRLAQIKKDAIAEGADPNSFSSTKKSDLKLEEKTYIGKDAFLARVQEHEQKLFEVSLGMLDTETAERVKELYAPISESLAKVQTANYSDFLKPRNLKPGREYIDMFEAAIDYYRAIGYKLANDEAKTFTDLMLSDKEVKEHPQIQKTIKAWADNLTRNKSAEYQQLKNGIFTYYLGYNISSVIIESMQPLLTTVPIIIENNGGDVKSAYSLLNKSLQVLANARFKTPKTSEGRMVFNNNDMLTKNYNRAVDERVMEFGTIDELSMNENAFDMDSVRLAKGLRPMTKKEKITQPLNFLGQLGRGIYSVASGTNAKISYIVGHELAVQRGMDADSAHLAAKEFVRRTTHSGAEYNRALGFSKLGKFQSAASVLYTLQNFTFATLHMMSRLVKDSFGADGLSKADQRIAQKSVSTLLGTQLLLAGSFGLPFAGGAIALWEQLTDDTIRDDIRKKLASVSGNTEIGAAWADVATRGLPTLLGIDAQSRFGLGSVLGLSEYNGFDLTGFLGAAGSLVENAGDAVINLNRGDPYKAAKSIVPQAFKRPIEMLAHRGQYLDNKGELLVEPNAAEQFAYLIGFMPKRFSDVRLMQRINRQSNAVANRERRQALREIAKNFEEKSPRQIQAEIQYLKANNPLFEFDSEEDIIGRVVEVILESKIPLDPLRTGSLASVRDREGLAQTMPSVRRGAPTEAQRLALKSMIESTITGRQIVPSATQINKAQMLDRFLASDPYMSPQRARHLLQEQESRAIY